MSLSSLILSDPVIKWVFTQYNKDAYLVGGYVRDILRGEISNDRDFAVKGNVEKVAMEAAQRFNGTLVALRKDHTYRVVMKDKSVLDFSLLADNIEMDLSLRDYTINAIAWSPETDILDYTGGMQDLQNKLIRAVSSHNIVEDPLRIIRAYRLASQLEFDIDANTRSYLKKYSPQILNVSAERVTNEVFMMLSCHNILNYIELCLLDNVLHEVFGVSNPILKVNMESIGVIDTFWQGLNSPNRNKSSEIRLKELLNAEISQSLSAIGLIRLFVLSINPESPTNSCLLPSGKIARSMNRMYEAYQVQRDILTCDRLYEILRAADTCEYEFVTLISILDNLNVDKYLKRADEYLEITNHPLLTGDEIQDVLNISPGRQIGEIKEEIVRGQFAGKIRNKQEAHEWIISNLT